jgi:hypothetical protein
MAKPRTRACECIRCCGINFDSRSYASSSNIFDETNDSLWFRIAFVATIIDIRPVRGDDILIGTIPEGETEVAVLRIHAVGSSKQSTLQQDTVIVCPVGKERDLWLRWLNQKSEMLFEYNRIGNRQFVQKCGC